MRRVTVALTAVGLLVGFLITNAVMNHLESVERLRIKHEQHLAATHLMAEVMQDLDKRVKKLEKRPIADLGEGIHNAPEVFKK
jgi:hypothetical protein